MKHWFAILGDYEPHRASFKLVAPGYIKIKLMSLLSPHIPGDIEVCVVVGFEVVTGGPGRLRDTVPSGGTRGL